MARRSRDTRITHDVLCSARAGPSIVGNPLKTASCPVKRYSKRHPNQSQAPCRGAPSRWGRRCRHHSAQPSPMGKRRSFKPGLHPRVGSEPPSATTNSRNRAMISLNNQGRTAPRVVPGIFRASSWKQRCQNLASQPPRTAVRGRYVIQASSARHASAKSEALNHWGRPKSALVPAKTPVAMPRSAFKAVQPAEAGGDKRCSWNKGSEGFVSRACGTVRAPRVAS